MLGRRSPIRYDADSMSLVVSVYVPSGIVMAADSRMSALLSGKRQDGDNQEIVQQQIVLSDSAYKVVALPSVGAGVSLYDSAVIDNRPADSHLHAFAGEADTFYLEDAVHLLAVSLLELGSDAVVEVIPGRNHMTVADRPMLQRIDRELLEIFDAVH